MSNQGTSGILYMKHRWGPAFMYVLEGFLDRHRSFTIPMLATAVRNMEKPATVYISHRDISLAVTDIYHNADVFEDGWVPATVGGPTKKDGDDGKRYRVWCFLLELRDMTAGLHQKHRNDAKQAVESYRAAKLLQTTENVTGEATMADAARAGTAERG